MTKIGESARTYFYSNTKTSWEAMIAACDNALNSIDIEEYIFEIDEIGRRFLNVLIKKAEMGVRVRILVDMVGSLNFYLSDLPTLLKSKGIEVQFFNAIKMWRVHNITSHFFRDHRKILVIDDRIGFIGGVGIRDDMTDWRDTMVEIHGEFVLNLLYSFNLVWRRVLKNKYYRFKKPPIFNKDYELLINSPRFKQRFIYYSLISRIRSASKRIYLATPYFIPDRRFLRVLKIAVHRGVDVRIIIPAVSNQIMIDTIQSWYIKQCLKGGIKVYKFGPHFYHAKLSLIDDWASVGSANLDNLSFFFNHEANLGSNNLSFVASVEHQLEQDLKLSEQVSEQGFSLRSVHTKIMEILTWPFHKFF